MAFTEEQKKALAEAKKLAKEKAEKIKANPDLLRGDMQTLEDAPGFFNQSDFSKEILSQAQQATNRNAAADQSLFGPTMTAINSTLGAITGGGTDLVQRNVAAGLDYVMDRNQGGEASYSDLLDAATQRIQDERGQYPISDIGGQVLGSVGTGTAIAKKAAEEFPEMAGNIINRLLGSGSLGAAEATSTAAGRGELTEDNAGLIAGIGAVGGKVGQALGEVAGPVSRWVGSRFTDEGVDRVANERLGASLTQPARGEGSLAARLNEGAPIEYNQLAEMAMQTGGPADIAFAETGGVLGEQAQKNLMEEFIRSSENPTVAGMTTPASELGARRAAERGTSARSTLEENLAGGALPDMSGGKEAYKEIFDSSLGKNYPVASKDQLVEDLVDLTDADGNAIIDFANRKGPSERLIDRLQKEVDDVTDGGTLTMRGLQNVKQSIDKSIKSAWKADMTAKDAMDVKDLVILKNHVRKAMEEGDPAYAQASARYADEVNAKDAQEMGGKLLRGTNNTLPVTAVSEYMTGLTPAEKLHAQQGSIDWLLGQLDQNPNMLKKVAGNEALHKRLEAVFGDRITNNATTLGEIAESVGRDIGDMKQYERLANSQSKHAGATIGRPVGAADRTRADTAIVGTEMLRGHGPTGLMQSAIRRLWSGQPEALAQRTAERQQELFQAQSPYSALSIIDQAMAAQNAPNAGMMGGGAGAGVGTALGINTLDQY